MTDGVLELRAARAEDVAAVVRLERESGAPHWNEAEYAAILSDAWAEPRRCLLVAVGEAGLVGFAVGKVVRFGKDAPVAETMGELETVAVEASARRQGLGRRLCGAVVDWCREQGAGWVELEVRAGNSGAISLYRGMEFAEVGRRRAYYRAPVEDGVLMRLVLSETVENL